MVNRAISEMISLRFIKTKLPKRYAVVLCYDFLEGKNELEMKVVEKFLTFRQAVKLARNWNMLRHRGGDYDIPEAYVHRMSCRVSRDHVGDPSIAEMSR